MINRELVAHAVFIAAFAVFIMQQRMVMIS